MLQKTIFIFTFVLTKNEIYTIPPLANEPNKSTNTRSKLRTQFKQRMIINSIKHSGVKVINDQRYMPKKTFLKGLTSEPINSGLVKKNENLYWGKIKNRNLWCVMERVTDSNLRLWKHYIDIQCNISPADVSQILDKNGQSLQKGHIADGADYFKSALEQVNHLNNEIWVAYITNNCDLQPIPQSILEYNNQKGRQDNNLWQRTNTFANGIEMFVTVISSPTALITTHMGIARSYEALRLEAPRRISMDLHSFCAKVMLSRNPKRQYMITVPEPSMRNIMIKSLPQTSIFFGTKFFAQIANHKEIMDMQTYAAHCPETTYKGFAGYYQIYQNLHAYFHMPQKENKNYLALYNQYPARIEVDGDRTSIKTKMIVYNKLTGTQPILIIDQKNKNNYQWLFIDSLATGSKCPYIAVDLTALANHTWLEPQ